MGKVLPVFSDIGTRIAGASKAKRTFNVIPFSTFHRGFRLALSHKFLQVQFFEFGFGIKGINMRGTSLHGQKDAALDL